MTNGDASRRPDLETFLLARAWAANRNAGRTPSVGDRFDAFQAGWNARMAQQPCGYPTAVQVAAARMILERAKSGRDQPS